MPKAERFKRLLGEPALFAVMVLVVCSLAVFVFYPIVRVLLFPRPVDFVEVPLNQRYLGAAVHSLAITGLSTLSATLFGFIFAYTTTRTNVPFRRFFRGVSILPLFSPPFMVAFSYMMMFGRNGLISRQLLGLDLNIFGWHGLWLSETIAFFPTAALVMEGVLQSIAPSLEHAARNLGAKGFGLFRTVTLPLSVPGLAGAALLVAIQVLADFGNPIMIAGDYSVLATEAWLRVEGWGDVRGAAVLSSLLLVPSFVLFLVQRYWVRQRSYITVTGKLGLSEIRATAVWLRALLFAFCALVSAMILLVYAALLIGAFVEGWGFDWTPTLRYVQEVLSRSPELGNSLSFSLAAGAVSSLFAMTAAYLVTRKRFPLRSFVDFACILPAALPGIFFGIGYSIAFTSKPFDLYGTAALIVLSMIFWNVSMGYQTGIGTMSQISPSFSEAAANLGASSLRIFRQIELPLIRGALFSAFTVSFIRAITTLSVVVFLSTSTNAVATFSIMNLVSDGFYGKAAALTGVLLAISFGVLGLARLAMGKRAQIFKV